MIIDFTIKNFRSIKDEQLFSMSAEHPKAHLLDNIAYPGDGRFGVLKAAGLYGANASGKSNVLLAFRALQWIADDSGDLKEDARIPCYEPYLLSEESSASPVVFELEFVNSDSLRYVYSVSYTASKILTESLEFYPSRQKACIFRREESDTWETIYFGGLYKGGSRRIPFFGNNSYLAKAGNNAASPDFVRSVYGYIRSILHMGATASYINPAIYRDDFLLEQISKFLCSVDTGIKGISKTERKSTSSIEQRLPKSFPVELKEALMDRDKYRFHFSHLNEDGELVTFRENQESDGTQKLFHLLPMLFEAFALGSVVIMDELDNSLHPHVAELLIKLFCDPVANKNNAQLIFSTHNMMLMSPDLMRRDQIWFVEKNGGATHLYSLDEFDKASVKSSSPFTRWYDEGRFGALPDIEYSKIVSLLSDNAALLSSESKVLN